ncbi:MAG: WD40 repeat domain-containing serine/threonine-protein kinase [Cyanobacteria bacterium P01_A01_bin.135]
MSYCFNPLCPEPGLQRVRQLEAAQFCSNCGAPLQLIDRYRATVRVGEGQFGQTFMATDMATGNRCVIRQMPPPVAEATLLQVGPLRQRSQALRQQSCHPQLPLLLAWFIQQEHYYWVFQFVDGPTLDHTKVALDKPDVLRLLNALLPLLQTLHGAGVYHGDIKPANVILSPLAAAGRANAQCHLVGFDFGRSYDSLQAACQSDLQQLGRLCAYLLAPHPKPVWADFQGQVPPTADEELRRVVEHMVNNGYGSASEAAAAIAALSKQDGPTFVPNPVAAPASDSFQEAAGWTCRHTLRGHEAWVRAVAVSSDGRWAISGSGDRTAKVWNLKTGALQHTLTGHTSWVRAVTASPNAPLVATASNDKLVRVWDIETGRCHHTLQGHGDWVRSAIFLSQRRLASAGQDKAILLWDLPTNAISATLEGHQHWILDMALAADGARLVSASRDRTLRLWDLTSATCQRVLAGHQAEVTCTTFCPKTGLIISGSADQTIRYWDPNTGKCLHTLTCGSSVNSLAVQPRSQLLAAGCSDKTISLWNLDHQPLGKLTSHNNWVWSVSFSPTAPVLVSGSWDATVKIWCSTAL